MTRSAWAWLVVAAVPACGANIDVGGPRANPTTAGRDSEVEIGASGGGTTSQTDSGVPGGAGTKTVADGGSSSSPTTGGGEVLGGMPAAAGAGGSTPNGGDGDGENPGTLKHGSFKILVLSTTLEFHHDSIAACDQMLSDLGMATAPERATIAGLAADTTWTVDHMGSDTNTADYFSEMTAENLASYDIVYSNNPTGAVFTQAPEGAKKKLIFQTWFEGGGSWAGQHSATDFENNNRWSWWDDHVAGGWFANHDSDETPGTIAWQTEYANHPIVKGLPSPWNANDEWYVMNRDIEAVPGFKILGKVTVSTSSLTNGTEPRPAVWVTENARGGRAFYTIRGHSSSRYAEPAFRQLMLRGILWDAHRLPGGN